MKVGDTVIINNTDKVGRYIKHNGEEVTVISIIKHDGDTVVTAYNEDTGYVTMLEAGFKETPMTLDQFIKLKSFHARNINTLPSDSRFLAVVTVSDLQHYFPQLVTAHVNS